MFLWIIILKHYVKQSTQLLQILRDLNYNLMTGRLNLPTHKGKGFGRNFGFVPWKVKSAQGGIV